MGCGGSKQPQAQAGGASNAPTEPAKEPADSKYGQYAAAIKTTIVSQVDDGFGIAKSWNEDRFGSWANKYFAADFMTVLPSGKFIDLAKRKLQLVSGKRTTTLDECVSIDRVRLIGSGNAAVAVWKQHETFVEGQARDALSVVMGCFEKVGQSWLRVASMRSAGQDPGKDLPVLPSSTPYYPEERAATPEGIGDRMGELDLDLADEAALENVVRKSSVERLDLMDNWNERRHSSWCKRWFSKDHVIIQPEGTYTDLDMMGEMGKTKARVYTNSEILDFQRIKVFDGGSSAVVVWTVREEYTEKGSATPLDTEVTMAATFEKYGGIWMHVLSQASQGRDPS